MRLAEQHGHSTFVHWYESPGTETLVCLVRSGSGARWLLAPLVGRFASASCLFTVKLMLRKTKEMTKREQEHYEVARRFGVGRPFSRPEFIKLYRREYPERKPGAMIPSDYCINLSAIGTEGYPKFLRWLGRGQYELVEILRPA